MNREWRHQFWPDITIEKGCWNVIAVPLWEETLRNMFFWINGTFNYAMECVEGIKLFSRVQNIKEILYSSIFAFYKSNVVYLHSFESIKGIELLKTLNPSK